MRFSYFGSGKFSAVDLVFSYYPAGVFDIDMFDGRKGFSTTGKLSPMKIPSSRLASTGSTRMGQKELCCLEFMVFALQHSSQRRTLITQSQTRQLTVLSFSIFRNKINKKLKIEKGCY